MFGGGISRISFFSIDLVKFGLDAMNFEHLQAYLVCATPRSGSTLLCEMLRETGYAGQPLEHFEVLRHSSLPRQPREYFEDAGSPRLLGLLEPTEAGTPSAEAPEQWWARIVAEGLSDNGVWAGKLMWGHAEDFLARARQLPGLGGADLRAALWTLLGEPRFVFVTRREKVEQAVSLWRAVQTRTWRAGEDSSDHSPVYDFEGIDLLLRRLESEERAWSEWFADVGVQPIHVTYEQLDTSPSETVTLVLGELGLPAHGVDVPRLSRQRDELSSIWIDRYRQELEQGRAA
jgi:trehalose 2-sulfotransferase